MVPVALLDDNVQEDLLVVVAGYINNTYRIQFDTDINIVLTTLRISEVPDRLEGRSASRKFHQTFPKFVTRVV